MGIPVFQPGIGITKKLYQNIRPLFQKNVHNDDTLKACNMYKQQDIDNMYG